MHKITDNSFMKLFSSLQKNLSEIKKNLPSDDVIYHNAESNKKPFCVIYIDSITDKNQLGLLVLTPLLENKITSAASATEKLHLSKIVFENELKLY